MVHRTKLNSCEQKNFHHCMGFDLIASARLPPMFNMLLPPTGLQAALTGLMPNAMVSTIFPFFTVCMHTHAQVERDRHCGSDCHAMFYL